MNSPEQLLMITNSGAGTADEKCVDTALGVLCAETTVEVHATSSPDDLDDVVAKAGDRRIVVAGGDGSLHAVIEALQRNGLLAGRVLGLLPLGTGNDFARAVGIPLDVEAAARCVLDGAPRRMDLLVDDAGGVVVNNVHLGAGADAGRRGHRWKKRLGDVGVKRLNLGKLGYPIGTLLTMINPPRLRVRVEVDGELMTGADEKVLMVALGNGASVGGGTELTPGADPGDGWIDVLVATPVGRQDMLRYAVGLLARRHPEHRDVVTRHGRTVTVTDAHGGGFWCSADGEIDGPVDRRSWRLQPAAYAITVPAVGQENPARALHPTD